jgi:hypothetical protein
MPEETEAQRALRETNERAAQKPKPRISTMEELEAQQAELERAGGKLFRVGTSKIGGTDV